MNKGIFYNQRSITENSETKKVSTVSYVSKKNKVDINKRNPIPNIIYGSIKWSIIPAIINAASVLNTIEAHSITIGVSVFILQFKKIIVT